MKEALKVLWIMFKILLLGVSILMLLGGGVCSVMLAPEINRPYGGLFYVALVILLLGGGLTWILIRSLRKRNKAPVIESEVNDESH
ncbi:MAG: hypothetical protein EG825_09410 [Rhodocyclaceae bacterium]|nr:hypothetical protein [Rhodocyclaceae bacterium]